MKIENAEIQWLDSGLPYSSMYQDIYHSEDDAAAESRHVFIDGNRLKQRWQSESQSDTVFTIAELGFGTGLNFLQAVALWRQNTPKACRLHYLGFEKHPLRRDQLQRIYQSHGDLEPGFEKQLQELLRQYPQHSSGCHRICFADDITLDLYYGDALEQLNRRYWQITRPVDCWFLDGFSPKLNTELWTPELFQAIAKNSGEASSLSSYSVAGHVRSALKSVDFEVSKVAGFGRKRHMLSATYTPRKEEGRQQEGEQEPGQPSKPWLNLPRQHPQNKQAIVIGAGLAGCAAAHSLAIRGWQVKVLEKGEQICSGASAIKQMALRCRLFNKPSALAEFYLHCFLFASRQFNSLLRQHPQLHWKNSGVIQLDSAWAADTAPNVDALQALYDEEVIKRLSRSEASVLAGTELTSAGWILKQGGWLNPRSLCQVYLSHKNISFRGKQQVETLEKKLNGWRLETADKNSYQAPVVIICNSHDANKFAQFRSLPLNQVRGQTSRIRQSASSKELSTVINGKRSVFPSFENCHTLAASYSRNTELQSRDADNRENLMQASRNFQDESYLNQEIQSEQVSLRCNSEDQLPLIGMAPDFPEMKSRFAALRLNAKAKFKKDGAYLEGLYLNIAHGSNGLASGALSGELLGSMINGENLAVSSELVNALNPVRFLIRNMKKQKAAD